MQRIGKTDQGGILLEVTEADINRIQQAMNALADLLVENANYGMNPEEIKTPPLATKSDRTPTRSARTGVERSGHGPSLEDVPEFQRARSMAGEEG